MIKVDFFIFLLRIIFFDFFNINPLFQEENVIILMKYISFKAQITNEILFKKNSRV